MPLFYCASPTATNVPSAVTKIATATLVPGKTLRFPISDGEGRLLLAAGLIITEDLKQALEQRQIYWVRVAEEDARTLAAAVEETHEPESDSLIDCLETPGLGREITAELDRMIDVGALFARPAAKPLKDRIATHGLVGYDPPRRRALRKEYAASAEALEDMILHAAAGGICPSGPLLEMAGRLVVALAEDRDLLMATAAEPAGGGPIAGHCLKVAALAMGVGLETGLDEASVRTLGVCGLVHDWGMAKVPEAIRDARRALDAAEFHDVKKHPVYTLEMLGRVSGLPKIVPLVCYQVHERPDGSGYPKGTARACIHPLAKILNAVDRYAVLTSHRPSRPALMAHHALECLLSLSAEGLVDPEVVQHMLPAFTMYPIGSFVELSDGSLAQTVRRNGNKFSKPIVRIARTPDGMELPEDEPGEELVIDLAAADLRVTRAVPSPISGETELTPEILESDRR